MNAITSRLPAGIRGRRLSRRLGGIGVVNGLLGAAVVGAGIAAYFVVAGTSSPPAPVRTTTVARGVVLSTISATGSLQAAQALSVDFTSPGTITSVAVKAGQHVKRGQVLGRVDSTSAQQSMQQAEASLATAQAQYEQTLTGETAQQRKQDALSVTQSKQSLATTKATAKQDARQSSATIANAQGALRTDQGQEKVDLYQQKQDQAVYATTDLANAAITADKAQLTADQSKQQGDQQQQLTLQHQQTVDKQNLSQAQTDLQQSESAKDTAGEASAQNQVDDFTSAVNNDQSQLDALAQTIQTDGFAVTQDNTKITNDQAALTALQNDAKAIVAGEAKIASDRQSLDSARMSATAAAAKDTQSIAAGRLALKTTVASVATKQAPPAAATLASARAAVVNAQVGVETARKALDDTTLRAPIGGIVADVSGMVGTQTSGGGNSNPSAASTSSSSTGSSASSGFVTLTGLHGMQLVASFAETDTAKLRVGQAATVTVDALPSTELAGHVIAIAGTATSSSGVVTYPVTFALDRSESGLKPGMTANVDVVVGEADNVLHVPTAAVNGSGANATVTVLRNGQQVRVPVVAGLAGDSSTAILSGLTNGESVVLPSVSFSTSGGTGLTGGTSTTSSTSGGGARFRGGGGGLFGGLGG
jgi:multidrug efflux pump subunit AcrA (membrane-fusion protein)